MVRKVLVLAAVLISGTVHAEQLPLSITGAGQKTYGSFISAVGNTPPGQFQQVNTRNGQFDSELRNYQSWLMGFITGVNAESMESQDQQINGVDIAAVDLWMRNWCNAQPIRIVLEGAMAFRKKCGSSRADDRPRIAQADLDFPRHQSSLNWRRGAFRIRVIVAFGPPRG